MQDFDPCSFDEADFQKQPFQILFGGVFATRQDKAGNDPGQTDTPRAQRAPMVVDFLFGGLSRAIGKIDHSNHSLEEECSILHEKVSHLQIGLYG